MIATPTQIRPEHYLRSLIQITPIRITPEILKANGFEKKGNSWYFLNLRVFISVEYNNKKWSLCVQNQIGGFDSRGRYDLLSFHRDWCEHLYVHEFQHALRDCKIQKEIVL